MIKPLKYVQLNQLYVYTIYTLANGIYLNGYMACQSWPFSLHL